MSNVVKFSSVLLLGIAIGAAVQGCRYETEVIYQMAECNSALMERNNALRELNDEKAAHLRTMWRLEQQMKARLGGQQ